MNSVSLQLKERKNERQNLEIYLLPRAQRAHHIITLRNVLNLVCLFFAIFVFCDFGNSKCWKIIFTISFNYLSSGLGRIISSLIYSNKYGSDHSELENIYSTTAEHNTFTIIHI